MKVAPPSDSLGEPLQTFSQETVSRTLSAITDSGR